MNETPIPRDIPLPLPAPRSFLEVLLIVAFIAHIVFVNLMVGGSLLVFYFQWRGRRQPDFDKLARSLAGAVTVNKSLAVVLGVAPLLLVNVLYTMHIYTANALTGIAWIALVPMITVAFVALYAHGYTWDLLAARKTLHLLLLGVAVALFLVIPFVFLANVTLMMMPERWTSVSGLGQAMLLPGVLPRYAHFMSASVIASALFGVGYVRRRAFVVEGVYESMSREALLRELYLVAFVVSLAQFGIGPMVLVALPAKGLHGSVVGVVLMGAAIAILPVTWMWRELRDDHLTGRRLLPIAAVLGLTVLAMATGRHMYRGIMLADHMRDMQQATEAWVAASEQASYDGELAGARAASGESAGETVFKVNCSACHGVDTKVVGPPLTEIAKLYADNPAGIVAWARAPGKKRADAPQMPPFASLGDGKLADVAKFMLEKGKGGNK
ncbi:MAG: c-type cytochrome [Polyangiaceae bacterium]